MPQAAGDTAAGQRSDDAAADADLEDAADAAAAQAAMSRHDDGDKSATSRSAGILGLSDDLDARSLVSWCSPAVSGKQNSMHLMKVSLEMQKAQPCSVEKCKHSMHADHQVMNQ